MSSLFLKWVGIYFYACGDTASYKKTFGCLKKSSIIIITLKPQTMQIFMHLWVVKTKVYKILDMIKSVCLLCAGNFVKVTHINFADYTFYSCDAALISFKSKCCSSYTMSWYDLPPWISSAAVEGLTPAREMPDLLWVLFHSKLMFWVLLPKPNYWKLSFFLLYHCKNK